LLSLWSWEEVPALPPEQILLPPRAPLSIYSFGCWTRQTLVALSIASALNPTVGVPFGIRELQTGVPAETPNEPIARAFTALVRGADWLAGREVRVRGDWSVRRPKLAPGGFPFEFANDNYPDVDDTAVVVLALRRAGIDGAGAADRGVAWSVGMQSSDCGWAAFDVDNTSPLPARLPFCDFGAVTDPPSADVTAHMVEMLAHEERADDEAMQQ